MSGSLIIVHVFSALRRLDGRELGVIFLLLFCDGVSPKPQGTSYVGCQLDACSLASCSAPSSGQKERSLSPASASAWRYTDGHWLTAGVPGTVDVHYLPGGKAIPGLSLVCGKGRKFSRKYNLLIWIQYPLTWVCEVGSIFLCSFPVRSRLEMSS